ncbi:hypothetical protein Ndes2526B_g01617 [Nannochloris sp. 'desiccata']|nr:hypothetical protein KSW81_005885 [Chlorella desiccata (nom. nud.)]KAH7623196.1 putative Bifunctional peptidase and arginyl-hydroxylase JMJD5 [Chlorella desiccata (nom. nud.)]
MVVEQNCLLNAELHSITPEFKNVLSFLKKHPNLVTWPSCIPYVDSVDGVLRLRSSEASSQLVDALTTDEGKPVIISEAATTWPAFSTWTIESLRQKSSSSSISVRVNNRAPARHADMLPGGGGQQQSLQISLKEYLNYMNHMPDSLDKIDDVENYSTPFYLNGWRAFADIPLLSQDCPALPEFSTSIDDTLALLAALDAQLFKSLQAPASSTEDSIAGWCHQVNDNLRKLFICPPGCSTRLHYDAGSAHGWLAQIKGRKLFILYPPSDTQNLYPLDTEIETVQSPIDPLRPDTDRWPNIKNAHPVACILQPGEAVVIPQGWWHYAVALDKSITLQRNFYHAGSNAAGLVQMVLKTAASLEKNGGS